MLASHTGLSSAYKAKHRQKIRLDIHGLRHGNVIDTDMRICTWNLQSRYETDIVMPTSRNIIFRITFFQHLTIHEQT